MKKKKINPALVVSALLLIVLGSGLVYGAATLLKLNLSFLAITFPTDRLEQALTIALGSLIFSLGASILSLSKRFKV